MYSLLFNAQFLYIAAANLCLFLIVSTWSFLPVFIVERGGNAVDVGLVMGSLGVTSLGSLPILAPLIDRYGRRKFIIGGILLVGFTNAGFLLFETYSPLMIVVRLIQGVAFAACFNGCATAVVDRVPPEHRAQGIGLFGVSGSLAVAIGPYMGETLLLRWGWESYFLLLIAFGMVGFLCGLMVREPERKSPNGRIQGFFPTARQNGYLPMMTVAAIFGSGFAAMNTFFPLFAQSLGLRAAIFFVGYGFSLITVRVVLGQLTDRVNRDKLIVVCLIGFGIMLSSTSQISTLTQTALLGMLFGVVQGLSYPAMMARMVDRSSDQNRAVVVSLFTGSFGVGINVSVLAWGWIANLHGLNVMFLVGGIVMFISAAACMTIFFMPRPATVSKAAILERESDR
jgi:MFS family permease